jgi:hypothetical protein
MPADRTHHLLTHLALALAGVCLTCALAPYLPELLAGLVWYLGLVALAWRKTDRWALPAWAANLFGLLILAGAALWGGARVSNSENTWVSEVPLAAIVIPYLGPVLMALLLVRLFRPRTPGDFWLLQGLGLLQVALGCVLASGTLFGVCLLAYLVVAVCALASRERRSQVLRWGPGEDRSDPRRDGRRWLRFALRWALAVAVLTGPLFLLTPRLEGPDWDPVARFGMQPARGGARTGFSEEIDLRRAGRLEKDDTTAFTVRARDSEGRPVRALPGDSRWRGVVLDRYEDGVWRSESDLNWPRRLRGGPPAAEPGPDALLLEFRVPARAGGLFLADPVRLGPTRGELPVIQDVPPPGRSTRLFFEAGGTAAAINLPAQGDRRYRQILTHPWERDRYPAVRLREPYLRRLLLCPAADVGAWSIALARRVLAAKGNGAAAVALEKLAGSEAYLPPVFWEPVGQTLSDHLARSGEFGYSLEVRREDLRLDPVMDFLVNVKEGTCERYASALALMLRGVGIPARVVKGFRGAEHQGEGTYLVRNSHAHAWVEALVPAKGAKVGYEWVALDPTPSAEAAESALERWQRSGEVLWRDFILGYTASDQADLWERLTGVARGGIGRLASAGVWLALAPGLVLLAWAVSRRRRAGPWERGRASGSPYDRLRRLLERHTPLRAQLAETPAELAQRAGVYLASRPATAELARVPARVATLHYAMRYGGRAPQQEELLDAERSLDALAAALRPPRRRLLRGG